ncbi:hypothetical protein HDU98_001962 [Podochytrium sp. JEL0797]|nr:hypothetical protein HDU98_001962 [Podochytrium sp. JEL0797]
MDDSTSFHTAPQGDDTDTDYYYETDEESEREDVVREEQGGDGSESEALLGQHFAADANGFAAANGTNTLLQPSNRSANAHARLVLVAVLLLAPLLLAALWAALRKATALPLAVIAAADAPAAFAGQEAWSHVSNLTRNPHPFNSDENLRIRHYIINAVEDYALLAKSQGLPESWLEMRTDDHTNMTTQDGKTWYESNNVLVRINPTDPVAASKHALLLSAHFDTQTVAPGVVDNSIAVAVALELIRSLIYNPSLAHPLIINFNNGEELFLLGAGAFTLHPWFSSITAFINLDGTGAAPGARAMLFRTNSFDLMKQWQKFTPTPHASILFNDLVSKVPSDTDYRVYTAYGHLQGLDVAFYSYRYQYHSPDDSVEFSWPISAQHLGDNVKAAVIGICNGEILDTLPPAFEHIEHPISDVLPIPDFVYYDLFSSMTVTSGSAFRWTLAAIVFTTLGWAVTKGMKESYRIGSKRFLLRFFRPTAEAYIFTLVSAICALLGTVVLSKVKSFINPGSSYGLPILNILWIACWVFASFAFVPKIWPIIGESLGLRSRKSNTRRRRGSSEARRIRPTRSRATMDSSTSATSTPIRTASLPLQSARQPSSGPPLEKWLPYGLLGFWCTLLVFPTYILSVKGIHAGFFVAHWAFYSLLAVGFTQLVSPVAIKWWKQQGVIDLTPYSVAAPVVPAWHVRVIRFYEKQIWGVQLLLSSLIPGLLTLDIVDQFAISMPACIGASFGETMNDVVFAGLFVLVFVNLAPAFQMARRTWVAEGVAVGLVVPIWVACVLVFPLSRNEPQLYSFAQTWNITTPLSALTSTVDITFRYGLTTRFSRVMNQLSPLAEQTHTHLDCNTASPSCVYSNVSGVYLPRVELTGPATGVMGVTVGKVTEVDGGVYELEGVLTGVKGSRACTVSVGVGKGGVEDPNFVTYVDPVREGQVSRWEVEGGNGTRVVIGQDGRMPGFTGVPEVVVLRRGFGGEEEGMVVPFLARWSVEGGRGGNVTVGCYLSEVEVEGGRSLFWEVVKGGVGEWMKLGPGRFGGVRVVKTVYF